MNCALRIVPNLAYRGSEIQSPEKCRPGYCGKVFGALLTRSGLRSGSTCEDAWVTRTETAPLSGTPRCRETAGTRGSPSSPKSTFEPEKSTDDVLPLSRLIRRWSVVHSNVNLCAVFWITRIEENDTLTHPRPSRNIMVRLNIGLFSFFPDQLTCGSMTLFNS